MTTTRAACTAAMVVSAIAWGRAAAAQAQPPGPPPTPCASDADARRFDFWVGEWDVRATRNAQPAGTSRIEVVSGGCAILEHWTSRAGGTGKSLNFYNKRVGQWQQYWVGQGGDATQFTASEWRGPTLLFLADAVRADGTPIKRRLGFTPVAADTVRQHGELSTDGGRTWTTEYDLTYVRRR